MTGTGMTQDTEESVVDHTINALRAGIRDHSFAPGQRLIVADITRRLGVSAGPVREAIRRLNGEGLIDIQPNRGAVVRRFDAADIAEIFSVREAVEARAAELAALNIDQGDNRRKLDEIMAEAPDAEAEGGPRYIDHNARFHALIYEMAGNNKLREVAEGLTLPIYRMQFHQLMVRRSATTSARDHDRIVDAIRRGDGPAAFQAMRDHVRRSGLGMQEAVATKLNRLKP